MDNETNKGKPMTREETKALLVCIENSKIINNKTTKFASNKAKIKEWQRITDYFNATASNCRRTPQQVRLKWENLKKNARKRNTLIRMNEKTSGGVHNYIPPDDILDRVAALLSNRVDGFKDQSGGDSEPDDGDSNQSQPALTNTSIDTDRNFVPKNEYETPIIIMETKDNNNSSVATSPTEENPFNIPRDGDFQRKRMKTGDYRAARNLAIAEYYKVKKRILEANLEQIVLENEKLKLEINKLLRKD